MWRNVDDEGHHSDTLDSILDLRLKPNAVKNGFITDKHGRRRMRKTTAGVDLLVAIKDGIDDDVTIRGVSSNKICALCT